MRRLRLAVCAIVPVVLCLALWLASPLGSQGASPRARAASLQDKIQQTQSKISRRKGTERVLTSDIAAYSARIGRLQSRIDVLQTRQNRIQSDLDRKRAQLIETQDRLRQERARLARLRARLAEGRRILARRLVELYQADRPDLVTVVLNSKGFADLLERGEFLRAIQDQDNRIITVVKAAKKDATETAARLDVLERRQQQLTAIVMQRRDEVASVKGQLVDTRSGYQRTRAGKRELLGRVHGARVALENHLEELQKESARVQAQLNGYAPAGPIRGGSGRFIWPISGTVTSPFCEPRPWEACHPGMDIAAPTGTPIRAADGGRVAIAGWVGGYGNYTCIQHTSSLSTCYGHQSRINVSVGQSVSKGQIIGAVGSTGHSTGPHLHFEVRINGAVTNPMNYL